MENYLTILKESLEKKIIVLERIIQFNEKQKEIFSSTNVDMEAFDLQVEEKGKLIEQIGVLDLGFQSLYDKLSSMIEGNKETYKNEIKELQGLIRKVTELGVTVQVGEARNKKLIESFFSKEKGKIRQGRSTSKAALGYYKNMNHPGTTTSNIIDQKK